MLCVSESTETTTDTAIVDTKAVTGSRTSNTVSTAKPTQNNIDNLTTLKNVTTSNTPTKYMKNIYQKGIQKVEITTKENIVPTANVSSTVETKNDKRNINISLNNQTTNETKIGSTGS